MRTACDRLLSPICPHPLSFWWWIDWHMCRCRPPQSPCPSIPWRNPSLLPFPDVFISPDVKILNLLLMLKFLTLQSRVFNASRIESFKTAKCFTSLRSNESYVHPLERCNEANDRKFALEPSSMYRASRLQSDRQEDWLWALTLVTDVLSCCKFRPPLSVLPWAAEEFHARAPKF